MGLEGFIVLLLILYYATIQTILAVKFPINFNYVTQNTMEHIILSIHSNFHRAGKLWCNIEKNGGCRPCGVHQKLIRIPTSQRCLCHYFMMVSSLKVDEPLRNKMSP